VALLGDGQPGGQEGVADGAQHLEAALETEFGEVVEEDAAHTACFLAVLQIEVVVAPLLEAGVQLIAVGGEGALAGAVEVRRVFSEAVIGRQVHAAAEPPDRLGVGALGDEAAHVHVHRWHVWVARVEDQRHAHRLEAAPGQLGPVGGG